MPLLDENPNTPARTRRFNQILARLINRGVQAGEGLGSDDGVMKVNAGRSLFIPDVATGVACLLESPACVLDFLEVDLFADGGLAHANDTSVSPARDRLQIDLHATPGLEVDTGNGFRVKVPADVGLEVVSDGVQINLATDPGLEFSTGMRVLVAPGGFIDLDVNGISIAAGAVLDQISAGDGIAITPVSGIISIADFDDLPNLAGGDTSAFFVALWNTQIGGTPGMMSVLDLLAQNAALPDPIAIVAADSITFRQQSSGDTGSTTLGDLFNTIAVPRESHIDLLALAAEHAFS